MRTAVAAAILAAYLLAVAWLPGVLALVVIVSALLVVLFGLTAWLERRVDP